jgi:hypothetical protein
LTSGAAVTGHPAGVIERAFQLAQQLTNVEEIRAQLRKEGYASVDAHLMGKKIRSDLVRVIRQAGQEPGSA